MAYTKPFTTAQKFEALKAYRSFRNNLKELRNDYPPANRHEQAVLQKYREAIKAFGSQVSNPVDWIDADQLNVLESAARAAMLGYLMTRNLGRS